MCGLDAWLQLVVTCPPDEKLDGWTITQKRMLIVEWRKNHWVHALVCQYYPRANDGEEVELYSQELRGLAFKLKAWYNDPTAIPPCPVRFWQPYYGIQVNNAEYSEIRDAYRIMAAEEANTISNAADWLDNERTNRRQAYACYQSSYL